MNINNINSSAVMSATSPVQFSSSDAPVGTIPTATETIKQKILEPLTSLKAEKTEEDSKSNFSAEEAKKIANELNEHMDDLQTNLGFNIREDLNHKVIVEIKNRTTNELVRQIPSEELLVIKEKMEELTGLIFDESA